MTPIAPLPRPDRLGRVAAILPARNEAEALGPVLAAMPDWIDWVIVADNGSRDATAETARAAGAVVVFEPFAGYGAACLAGIARAKELGAEVFLFLDADGSDKPEEAAFVLAPIAAGAADLVIGSRTLGIAEKGALTLPQALGNQLAALLMRAIWRKKVTDLGPYRAITRAAYDGLGMRDRDFGWTVEMQTRALRRGQRVVEVPVSRLNRRAGVSKVSGTINGVLRAGTKILYVIWREWRMEMAERRAAKASARTQALSPHPAE